MLSPILQPMCCVVLFIIFLLLWQFQWITGPVRVYILILIRDGMSHDPGKKKERNKDCQQPALSDNIKVNIWKICSDDPDDSIDSR